MSLAGIAARAIIFFTIYMYGTALYAEEFLVIGHTQTLYKNYDQYKRFVEEVNKTHADFVFILGDSHLDKRDSLSGFNQGVMEKLYAVPGNHEHEDGIDSYLSNIGYSNLDIETDNLIYLLIDSSQSMKKLREILQQWRDKYLHTNKKVVLMTHHRIWDDSVLSHNEFQHDKSYYFRDIYPLLKGFVDYIIAGNSKRQHFQDLPQSLKNKNVPNITTTYWEEVFPDFRVFNVGMGNGYPYATYVTFDFHNDMLYPLGHIVKVSDTDLDQLGLLDINKYQPRIRDKNSKDWKYLRYLNSFYVDNKQIIFAFLLGMLLPLFLLLIVGRLNKRGK